MILSKGVLFMKKGSLLHTIATIIGFIVIAIIAFYIIGYIFLTVLGLSSIVLTIAAPILFIIGLVVVIKKLIKK